MAHFKFILWLAYWYLQTEIFEFEWDQGNSTKSITKHGVDIREVESIFTLREAIPIGRQVSPAVDEERLCLIGPSEEGRYYPLYLLLEKAVSGPLVLALRVVKKGNFMKKYAKKSKEYDRIDFDPQEIIRGMSRLKGTRRKPTSVALEEELLKELKAIANKRGVPYQILMRLLIADGVRRLKVA